MTTATRKMKALILEDSPLDGKVLLRFLEHLGFEAFLAKNQAQFLEIHLDKAPDICMIDLNIDVSGDGFVAIEKLKEIKSQSVIFVVSGETGILSVRKALDLGADDYILKPFDYQNLSIRLTRYFEEIMAPDKNRRVLPRPASAAHGEISIPIELISLKEERLYFQTNHLFLKEASVMIKSDILNQLLDAGGPHDFMVVNAEWSQARTAYVVEALWKQLGSDDLLRLRRNILKTSI